MRYPDGQSHLFLHRIDGVCRDLHPQRRLPEPEGAAPQGDDAVFSGGADESGHRLGQRSSRHSGGGREALHGGCEFDRGRDEPGDPGGVHHQLCAAGA